MSEPDLNLPQLPPGSSQGEPVIPAAETKINKPLLIGSVVLVVAALIAGIWFLASSPPEVSGKVRDIFIIFMGLEFLVIGVALVILIVQLSLLINLLQNEIKPILTSTNDTVNTIRGTVTFLSENLSEPVIKLNEYMAAVKRFIEFIRPNRS